MAKGFKHGAGGPGLNFKVIGNPQPETAKENTIWVDTDKINNYYFSAEQPENMVEYDVWFLIGRYSTVAFSAIKKNPVMVYPLSAKQYVNGALVDVTSKSYQGGKWVDWWSGELFDNGKQFEFITGGWWRNTAINIGSLYNNHTVEIGDTLHTSATSGGSAVTTTKNKIDFTGYKNLHITVDAAYQGWVAIHVPSSGNIVTMNVGALNNISSAGTYTLPVHSVTEPAYVSVGAADNRNITVSKLWLEEA